MLESMSMSDVLVLAMLIVPVVANIVIAVLRHYGKDGWADWVMLKAPLVSEILKDNHPKERAIEVLAAEVKKLVADPSVPVHDGSPVSVAVKELEALK